MSSNQLSVVVPAFNEVGNIDEFLRRVVEVVDPLTSGRFEIIFAVDPCSDGTVQKIEDASKSDPRIKMLVFSRRVGQPTATLAGLDYSVGSAAVVMDVDLQDPPEILPEMFELWRAGNEVVYAQRRHRDGETLIKRVVAKVGYGLIDRFGDVKIPRDTGDFRLLDRRVVDELKRFPRHMGFCAVSLRWLGSDKLP